MIAKAFWKKIGLRYLWTRRSEAFITVLSIISVVGVAIGVIVLNMVMAVMTGFEYELKEKIVGANSHIVVRRVSGKIKNYEEVVQKIERVPGVESAGPFSYDQALIRAGNQSMGLLIRGIPQGGAGAEQLASYLEQGQDLKDLFEPPAMIQRSQSTEDEVVLPGIVVGRELARSLGLLVGNPVSLLSASVSSSPFGLVPKYKRFLVVGTYSSGLIEYENGLAYVALPEAQKFFRLGDSVSAIEVRVKDINKSPELAAQIVDVLGGLSSGFYAQDWTQTNKPLWDALRLEKKVYFIILLLIVVMASFSIVSTLVMIVLEKRKDIAVLKTLGASASEIGKIFRFQGAVIGAVGTTIGLVLGYLGCIALQVYGFPLDERIFQMSTVPVRIEAINFIVTGVAAFLICLASTGYPVRKASRLDPSEVLRHE